MEKFKLYELEDICKSGTYCEYSIVPEDNDFLNKNMCIGVSGIFNSIDFYFNPNYIVFSNGNSKVYLRSVKYVEKIDFSTSFRDFFVACCTSITGKIVKYTFSARKC